MESRYALRELEGAIGYDTRTIEDGRAAVFKHTILHKKARWMFFERRDAIAVITASYVSAAALASNPRLDFGLASEGVSKHRSSFVSLVFPYMDIERLDEKRPATSQYDEYFDELERMRAARKARNETGSDGNPDPGVIGDDVSK